MEAYRIIYMWCLIVMSVWTIAALMVQVYFAYFKVDEILECLGESKVVSFRRAFIGSDVFSRAFL